MTKEEDLQELLRAFETAFALEGCWKGWDELREILSKDGMSLDDSLLSRRDGVNEILKHLESVPPESRCAFASDPENLRKFSWDEIDAFVARRVAYDRICMENEFASGNAFPQIVIRSNEIPCLTYSHPKDMLSDDYKYSAYFESMSDALIFTDAMLHLDIWALDDVEDLWEALSFSKPWGERVCWTWDGCHPKFDNEENFDPQHMTVREGASLFIFYRDVEDCRFKLDTVAEAQGQRLGFVELPSRGRCVCFDDPVRVLAFVRAFKALFPEECD